MNSDQFFQSCATFSLNLTHYKKNWSMCYNAVKITSRIFPAHIRLGENALKKSCKDVLKTSLEDVLQIHLEDILKEEKLLGWRRLQDFLENKECLLGCLILFCSRIKFYCSTMIRSWVTWVWKVPII